MAKSKSKKKKKKNRGLKAILIICWLVFLLLLGGFATVYLHENGIIHIAFLDEFLPKETPTDAVQDDNDVSGEDNDAGFITRYEYETNANLEINALVSEYLFALTSCDQAALKSIVTDPSQFDDMTVYETKANIIQSYDNINCYTIKGYNENETICYVLSNITISGVTSTPLDIVRFYIVVENGQYKIDNSAKSTEVTTYIDNINTNSDVQGLYKMVKDDITKCQQEDPEFYEFYQRLMN